MIRPRPLLIGVAAWVAGAVASVVVGLLALSMVDEHFSAGSGQPLVVDPISQADPAPGTPSPRIRVTPMVSPPVGPQRRITLAGGEVVAQCHGAQVYLLYWTPAPGYRADEVARGPAMEAKIKFAGHDREVELKVRCVNSVIRAEIEQERSDESR